MDQRQARHSIAMGRYLGCKTISDDLVKYWAA
jgi:hypothetical protein